MKPLRFLGISLSLLLVLPAAATPALGAPKGNGSALEPSSGQEAAASRDRIIQIRRGVKEALLDAALTTSEMSAAFGHVESFVESYTLGVRMGDPEVLSIGLDTYLERKVLPALRSFGLKVSEQKRVEKMVRTWVAEELDLAPGQAGQ